MSNTRELVKKHNIRLTKSLGQNFLTDDTVVTRIVDAAMVDKNDLVIEVGPGVGSMTAELAKKAGFVAAVEIDKHLLPALADNLSGFDNVKIIHADILEVNIHELIKSIQETEGFNKDISRIKVVANLPYYITTPIIMKFLEEGPKTDLMVFMVQKEVADRMAAKPGGKDYGALTVAVQYYSNPEKVFIVSPHSFIPQPEVDSTVIRLNVYQEPVVKTLDEGLFFRLVKAAFGQRRKTLINALTNSGYFKKSKEEIREILINMGINENARGETLSILQFSELANSFLTKN